MSTSKKPPCRHCTTRVAVRPRRLCCACYARAEVRERYPPLQAHAGAAGQGTPGRTLAAEATDALPGSVEKIEVLAERVRLGVALWHPKDARMGGKGP